MRDRVIILTGGAGLLGREYALALAGVGAYVVVADTNTEAGPKVVADAGSGMFIETDVTSKPSVQAMRDYPFRRRFCRIHGAVTEIEVTGVFAN